MINSKCFTAKLKEEMVVLMNIFFEIEKIKLVSRSYFQILMRNMTPHKIKCVIRPMGSFKRRNIVTVLVLNHFRLLNYSNK